MFLSSRIPSVCAHSRFPARRYRAVRDGLATCSVSFYLSRPHSILCRPNSILCRPHSILCLNAGSLGHTAGAAFYLSRQRLFTAAAFHGSGFLPYVCPAATPDNCPAVPFGVTGHVLNKGLTSRAPLSMRGRHSHHDHGVRQGVIAPCRRRHA